MKTLTLIILTTTKKKINKITIIINKNNTIIKDKETLTDNPDSLEITITEIMKIKEIITIITIDLNNKTKVPIKKEIFIIEKTGKIIKETKIIIIIITIINNIIIIIKINNNNNSSSINNNNNPSNKQKKYLRQLKVNKNIKHIYI